MSYYIILCQIKYIILYYIILCCIISYEIIWYEIILYHIISYVCITHGFLPFPIHFPNFKPKISPAPRAPAIRLAWSRSRSGSSPSAEIGAGIQGNCPFEESRKNNIIKTHMIDIIKTPMFPWRTRSKSFEMQRFLMCLMTCRYQGLLIHTQTGGATSSRHPRQDVKIIYIYICIYMYVYIYIYIYILRCTYGISGCWRLPLQISF